jgi:dienelactone hydrolase
MPPGAIGWPVVVAPPRRLRPALALVLLIGFVAPTMSCTTTSQGGQTAQVVPSAPAAEAARPFTVTAASETFVDRSRLTRPAGRPPSPGRSLETTLYVPDGEGPFPLIVFAHGLNGHPDKFTQLLTVWARAGYVVAAPAFPLTNNRVPEANSNIGDVVDQPGDVSFVITEMLRLNRERGSRVFERIDADRIGVGGLSLGGATTYAVAFNDCCRDDRVKAVQVFSGALLAPGEHELDGHVPLLMVHGDRDTSLPYQLATDIYAKAGGPVWFVTLIGAPHSPPFENPHTPYDALVERVTTDFWDATLGGDAKALTRFETDAVVTGLSSLQSRAA